MSNSCLAKTSKWQHNTCCHFGSRTLSRCMSTDTLEARAIKASLVGCAAGCGVGDQLPLTASRGGGEYHCFSFSTGPGYRSTQTTIKSQVISRITVTCEACPHRLSAVSVRITSPLRPAVKVTRDGE